MGTACASVLQEKIPNMSVTVQATGGSIENCRLLASGDINIGHTTQMYDAYVGQGPFAEDGPNDKILALMDLYDVESVAIVLDKSSIQSLEDLEGRQSFSVRPAPVSLQWPRRLCRLTVIMTATVKC